MKVLVTGAGGFIGKNLCQHLDERSDIKVVPFTRDYALQDLPSLLEGVDFVFHLAGVNRSQEPLDFINGNFLLTKFLVKAVQHEIRLRSSNIPIIYTSTIHANLDTPYGSSKSTAEEVLRSFSLRTGSPVYIFRLPNVYGKWCRPNYNSVVATFCHNIARGLPVQLNSRAKPLTLVHVDDVVERFIQIMDGDDFSVDSGGFLTVSPQYTITLIQLLNHIESFRDSRHSLVTQSVGIGFIRSLYSTYVSYLPPESFAYSVPMHSDARGVFVEMLKTPDSGQFSFFTAYPGITRGGHYHHTKTEKFLVIKGEARFRFRHMQTGEIHELVTKGTKAEIVETVPGWTHDITNIGNDEMLVMLWANEVFDRSKPDTYFCPF